jgi:hypothetical protein
MEAERAVAERERMLRRRLPEPLHALHSLGNGVDLLRE